MITTQKKSELLGIAANCADVNIVIFRDIRNTSFHTDSLREPCMLGLDEFELNDMPDEFEGDYEIMDEDDYNNTILANGCLSADFDEWYGNKNAKVLVIGISETTAISIAEQI